MLETQETIQGDKDGEELTEAIQKEKETFKVEDHIICLSEKTRQLLQYDYKIKPKKITVIYNGLTDNNSIIEKSTLRRKYHLPDTPILCLPGDWTL